MGGKSEIVSSHQVSVFFQLFDNLSPAVVAMLKKKMLKQDIET